MNGAGVEHPGGRLDPTILSQRAKPEAAATVVGICASTGGPRALEIIVAELPAGFCLPVLVVQHMAHGYLAGLVRRLAERTPLPVGIARAGQPAAPGIWFPPEDTHLVLEPSMRLGLRVVAIPG